MEMAKHLLANKMPIISVTLSREIIALFLNYHLALFKFIERKGGTFNNAN